MSWWDLRRVSTLQGQVEPLNLEWMIYGTIKLLLRMIWLWEWNSLAWMICPTFAELKIQVSGCPWLCRKSDFIMFPHLFASPGLLAEKTRYLFLSLAASIHIVGSILSIHLCIENPYLSWKKTQFLSHLFPSNRHINHGALNVPICPNSPICPIRASRSSSESSICCSNSKVTLHCSFLLHALIT